MEVNFCFIVHKILIKYINDEIILLTLLYRLINIVTGSTVIMKSMMWIFYKMW